MTNPNRIVDFTYGGKETMPDVPGDFLSQLDERLQLAMDGHQSSVMPTSMETNNDRQNNSSSNANDIYEGAGDGDLLDEVKKYGGDDYCFVPTLKTDFYEKTNGQVVVRVQPKPLNADAVRIVFSNDRFILHFFTGDKRFLSTYETYLESTRFFWICNLVENIVPDQCHFRVQNLIEITLQKENVTKKWTSLCAVQPREVSAPDQCKDTPTPDVVPRSDDQLMKDFFKYHQPSTSKPTCEVPPYNEIGQVEFHGYTGLRNLGNTCFMNASLQALVNTREFRDYFLEEYYLRDINRANPLGFKGRLAEAFGQFIGEMWSGMNRVYEPSVLKELVGLKSSQFANFAQHDAQEFLSFLLDGLHEDLNRVVHKPLTPTVESDGRPDRVVAEEAWRYHLARNDSFVVDLFHGQLKSRLECPECGHISITFDPFIYLPVPFPKLRRPITFYFWSTDHYTNPVKYTISFLEEGSNVADVFNQLSALVNVKPTQFRMIELFRQKVFKRYNVEDRLSQIRSTDTIFIFQIDDPEEVGEEVIELTIVQRQLHPRMPVSYHCASCGKESEQLRACMKCRTAVYCDVTCQKEDWPNHRLCCHPPSPELVGQPFMVSLPASRLTYQHLMQSLEARARHTVDVFQAVALDSHDNPADESQPSSSTLENDTTKGSETQTGAELEQGSCSGRPTKRVRLVLGEAQDQPRSVPLFKLALTNEDGEYMRCDGKEKRLGDTSGDGVLTVDNGSCLAMEWINKKGKSCENLVVLTKDQIDYVDDPTSAEKKENDQDCLQLSDLFEHFTETETLSADDAWYCSRCKEHKQARKTLQLWKLPSILIVQLKRFVYTSNIFRSKIDKHVVYPIRDFDLHPYMSDGAAVGENEKTVYDLYAVVSHSGTSFFGHYTSFARLTHLNDSTNTDIEWRLFDDSTVTRVKQETDLVDGDAYFLFYKRRCDWTGRYLDRYKLQNGLNDDED